jgi:integrase
MSTAKKRPSRPPGSVNQRGNKWSYSFDGPPDSLTGERQRIRKSGFDDEEEAWDALSKARTELLSGVHAKASKRTVAEFFEEWLPRNRGNVDVTTADNYETLARAYVIPVIGKRRLQEVDTLMIASLYQHLLENGRKKVDTQFPMFEIWREVTKRGEKISPRELAAKVGVSYSGAAKAIKRFQGGQVPKPTAAGLAKKSVASVRIMLKSAFADAMVWKYVTHNPTIGVKGPKLERRGHNTWTPAQLSRFLTTVKSERLYAMWVLVATTGMRRSEIAGLRFTGLDIAGRSLTVRNTRVVSGGKVHDGFGKSARSRRRMSLDRATLKVLGEHVRMVTEERKTWGASYQDHELVFCWENGRPIYPDTITEQLGRLAAHAGLPPLTLHELRHTYATAALRAGVHPKIVSSRLGHATVAFTLDTYTEDIEDLDEAAAQEISDLFMGAPGFGLDDLDVGPDENPGGQNIAS